MTKKANLFGVEAVALAEGRTMVEAALGISLKAHESDYHGGDYFKLSGDDFNVVFQTNFVEDDSESTEAEYPDVALLLHINGNEAIVDRLSKMASKQGFKLLRSSTY